MSLDRTMSSITYAATETQSAMARLRLAVAEALRVELRRNLPRRFQPGAVELYGYPPYAASTLKRKTTPPLVESGRMRQAALSTISVRIDPSNRITASVRGPQQLRFQHDAGRDILTPTPAERRRLVSRIRVLPSPTA